MAYAQVATPHESSALAACHGHTPLVVMVLSPRMVYSITEWPRMRQAAEAAGFAVSGLRASQIDDGEWQAAVQAANVSAALRLPRLEDFWAAGQLPAMNHFPTTVLQLGERQHPWPILGVMPDTAFVALLRQRLRQLCPDQP